LVSFEQRCKETLHQHLKFQVFQDSRICSLKMFLSLNGFQIFQDPGSAPVSSDPLESRALASATYLVKLQQPSALQGLEFCFKGEFFRDLGPQSELWWVNEVSEASANVDVTVGSQIQVITVTAAHNTSASAPTPPPQPTPGHYVPTAWCRRVGVGIATNLASFGSLNPNSINYGINGTANCNFTENVYIGSAGPRPAQPPRVVPQGKCCRNLRGEFSSLQNPPNVDCYFPWILTLTIIGITAPGIITARKCCRFTAFCLSTSMQYIFQVPNRVCRSMKRTYFSVRNPIIKP